MLAPSAAECCLHVRKANCSLHGRRRSIASLHSTNGVQLVPIRTSLSSPYPSRVCTTGAHCWPRDPSLASPSPCRDALLGADPRTIDEAFALFCKCDVNSNAVLGRAEFAAFVQVHCPMLHRGKSRGLAGDTACDLVGDTRQVARRWLPMRRCGTRRCQSWRLITCVWSGCLSKRTLIRTGLLMSMRCHTLGRMGSLAISVRPMEPQTAFTTPRCAFRTAAGVLGSSSTTDGRRLPRRLCCRWRRRSLAVVGARWRREQQKLNRPMPRLN